MAKAKSKSKRTSALSKLKRGVGPKPPIKKKPGTNVRPSRNKFTV
jgi:hypothetical protein